MWSRTLKSGAFHAHCFANYRCETLPHMWSRLVLAVVMTGISASDGLSATEELPKSCSQADVEKYGRPVMFERQRGIAFGVSARKTEFATNAGASAYIWLSNESDAPQHYGVC